MSRPPEWLRGSRCLRCAAKEKPHSRTCWRACSSLSRDEQDLNPRPLNFAELRDAMRRNGWGGIRTHGTLLTYTHFPGVRLKPLGHPSRVLEASKSPRLQEARPASGAGWVVDAGDSAERDVYTPGPFMMSIFLNPDGTANMSSDGGFRLTDCSVSSNVTLPLLKQRVTTGYPSVFVSH